MTKFSHYHHFFIVTLDGLILQSFSRARIKLDIRDSNLTEDDLTSFDDIWIQRLIDNVLHCLLQAGLSRCQLQCQISDKQNWEVKSSFGKILTRQI